MAAIILRRKSWQLIPPDPCNLSASFADAAFVVVPSWGGFNVADLSKAVTVQGKVLTTGLYGLGVVCPAAGVGWTVSESMPIGRGYTLFAIAAFPGNALQLVIDDDSATRSFQFRANATNGIDFIPFSGGTPGTIQFSSGIPAVELANGFPMAATVTHAGASAIWYRNAKNTGALGGVPTYPTGTVRLGAHKDNTSAMTKGLFVACGWPYVLTDAQLESLMDNPALLFAPRTRRLYSVPVASTFNPAWANSGNSIIQPGAMAA